ncbi:methylenetetrahydrofolate--tRNA-(uracil(54)-C(5))-methyltransferase (FADH(2)-oxidizing) TrmFO [Fluviispira multicolorata]|uniref:Methylenetetrahydrofolate--tRNA-(uracil-5-)-methyltransferase TrmFO n=1 Tax=Fluviispira multicolorata TaxID=2654512 RepID=A0A833JC22_9BACT|nr:methylenetetrahydrofolate--tRNA-(uracil(54)-C(5))-methyltransferase (FADH(2)-oxidizing) TrmFO [Fluviispira multicolorata]KAB8029918.1 methylenetetrahydrofolate--tRNA-(uracil(54)-C(5))-methyltransferase (FADH(2)-oxidizing) TrmFO [Fluviispira multicolorata]
MKVAVIGAGLAGSECTWVLAERYGIQVTLFEMKSKKTTPAQISPNLFAELVCSNSLKSKSRLNPAGTLKCEIEQLGSIVIPAAKKAEVPAGETLAVDREFFSQLITEKLKNHKNITIRETVVEKVEDVFKINDFSAVVIATGPLTEDNLANDLRKITGTQELYFYDAIAPILDGDTIDNSIAFLANRQTRTHAFEKKQAQEKAILDGLPPPNEEEEEGDYLNIPLNKEEYFSFVEKVCAGAKVPHKDFEEPKYFNGCQPIEVLAERGPRTLAFGPMKPRGLDDPRTGRMPYAVVQLRKEKMGDSAWNMVGFQTRLTWGAQKEILKTLPGLNNVEFFRMGSMHRNTYLVSPNILNEDFSLKADKRIYLAGQIMGVEGYLESSAMGVYIAHVIGQKLKNNHALNCPPANTSLGSLARYCIYGETKRFSPMNIHWGLFNELSVEDIKKYSINSDKILKLKKLDKSVKRELMACRSEDLFQNWLEETKLV